MGFKVGYEGCIAVSVESFVLKFANRAMELLHFHYGSVTSTNDIARELLRDYPAVLVSALYQTHGRGRHGRSWFGEWGKNVYCTIGIQQSQSTLLTHIAAPLAFGAVVVWDTLTTLVGVAPIFLLKYPNDLLGRCPDGAWRKLSGVLVERTVVGQVHACLIGIGINVQQRDFPPSLATEATSLALLGFELTPERVLQQLKRTAESLCESSLRELLQRWRALLQIEGRLLRIQGKHGLWKAVALHDSGQLEVEQGGERLLISDGDSLRYVLD